LWNVSIGGGTDPVANQESSLQDPGIEREVEWLKTAACQSDQQALAGWFGIEPQTEASAEETNEQADDAENETAGWAEREDASQPELLEARPQPVYTGPALPENCTMEDMNLGLDETTTPVMGIVSSGFGYRVHPIDGETKFHYGTDVAADVGTPVYAFADGVVDFIGESEAYGQYIQLRHDAGVTTFYAHCSKLCAKKGQKVAMGDVIALVGESGNTTGPHLHLEIRLDGEYLNPVNYIDTM
jgi:murein DD-endopeptidase MepM/ murein hydrolase activator NlpD